MQTAKDSGEDLTSVADIGRESAFRRAGKILVFILLIVLCMWKGRPVFSEMQIQDRAGAYGEEKRRIFCTAKEG